MSGLKQTGLAAATVVALLGIPITPAVAAGPLLLAPLILGRHLLGAVASLAILPLVAASAAVSEDPSPASYPPPRGYYAPPTYYGRAAGYYPAPQVYYPPALSYARPMPRLYAPSRGYYAPPMRYSGAYGAQVFYRSRGFGYRRR
jgi:hypothetical protein